MDQPNHSTHHRLCTYLHGATSSLLLLFTMDQNLTHPLHICSPSLTWSPHRLQLVRSTPIQKTHLVNLITHIFGLLLYTFIVDYYVFMFFYLLLPLLCFQIFQYLCFLFKSFWNFGLPFFHTKLRMLPNTF